MPDDPANPFSSLDKKKFPKSRKKQKHQPQQSPAAQKHPPQPAPSQQQAQHCDGEDPDAVFFQAMHGVTPLDGVKGREIAPPAPKDAEPAPVGKRTSEEAEVASHLQDLVSGKVEFALQYSDEFIHGHVLGLDSKLLVRLKAGYYSPEAHLDLHGMNAEQAFTSLGEFVRDSYMQGRRCILVIPGRGKNSPEGYGILREAVQTWLTRDPLKRVVLAFCTALPKHGGAGALYVMLRKHKGRGKINWQRMALDEPPYMP